MAGNYLGARVEYEHSIFSSELPLHINDLLLKKAQCYKAENDFEGAYQTLQRASSIENEKKTGIKILYESALLSLLLNKSDLALSHLEEIKYYFPDTTSRLLQVLEILSLNELHRWKDAQQKLQAYSLLYNLGLDDNVYSSMLNYVPKKTTTAEILSMLVPGTGQMYAGYFLKGLTSTIINSGLILFTIYSFSHGFYLSGAFTGVALFYLFYNGGAAFAHRLTEQKNNEVYHKFNNSIKKQLLEVNTVE